MRMRLVGHDADPCAEHNDLDEMLCRVCHKPIVYVLSNKLWEQSSVLAILNAYAIHKKKVDDNRYRNDSKLIFI